MIGSPMLSVQEAAYLMNISEEELQVLIDKGQLLVIESHTEDPPLIHESEVHRFVHPWQHIFRLDSRVDSLLALVETMKGRGFHCEDVLDFRSRLVVMERQVAEMRTDMKVIKERLWPSTIVAPKAKKEKSSGRKAVPSKDRKRPVRR